MPPALGFALEWDENTVQRPGMLEPLASMYLDSIASAMGWGWYPGWWLSPVIQALGRLRQKAHHEFVASLGYLVKFRVAWTRVGEPTSNKTKLPHQ